LIEHRNERKRVRQFPHMKRAQLSHRMPTEFLTAVFTNQGQQFKKVIGIAIFFLHTTAACLCSQYCCCVRIVYFSVSTLLLLCK